MNPQLMQSSLALLALGLIVSVVSSPLYFALRYLESRSRISCAILSVLICAILFNEDHSRAILTGYAVALAFGLIGGNFHRKSRNMSSPILLSFVLVSAVSSSICFAIVALLRYNLQAPQGLFIPQSLGFLFRNSYVSWIAFAFLIGQSITAPLLLFMWKNSRLRPGIDKPLSD